MAKKACITCGLEFEPGFTVCPDDGTPLTSLTDDGLIGTVLADRYEILEVIGGGGMGLVYKARHKLMNRIVAIKMLHRHMISSADTLKRFQLEAQAASCLSLPNILTVYDFGLTPEGQPYMVMDYLEGISLADVIEAEDHLQVDRAVNIFIQACAGLAHAHQKGVLHRDIKPSNIMLVQYGDQADFVKIVDFGIAKLLNAGNTGELTKTGEVYGSPSYMSPEQCRGKETDARSDIYALGCVMYRALTGHPLFSGDDIIELLFKQVSEPPATFDVLCPEYEIPPELEDIVFKALAKNAADRYQNMDAFKEALEYFRDKRLKPGESPRPLWKRPDAAPRAGRSASQTGTAIDATASAAPNAVASNEASRKGAASASKSRDEHTQRPRTDEVPLPANGGASTATASAGNATGKSTALRNSPADSMSRKAGDDGAHRSALRRKMSSDNKTLLIAIAAVALVALVGIFIVWKNSTNNVANSDHETLTAGDTGGGDALADGKAALDSQNYAQAKTSLEKAVSESKAKYGEKSPELANALSLLGSAQLGLKDYQGALTNATSALEIKQEKKGDSSADLVSDLVTSAEAQRRLKQLPGAEISMKRAVSIQEKAAGKSDLTTGNLDFKLAQIYRDAGKEKDADTLAQDALRIKMSSLGSDNPQISEIKTFLASAGSPTHATVPVHETKETPTPQTPVTPVTGQEQTTPPEHPHTAPVRTASRPEHVKRRVRVHHEAPTTTVLSTPYHRRAYSSY